MEPNQSDLKMRKQHVGDVLLRGQQTTEQYVKLSTSLVERSNGQIPHEVLDLLLYTMRRAYETRPSDMRTCRLYTDLMTHKGPVPKFLTAERAYIDLHQDRTGLNLQVEDLIVKQRFEAAIEITRTLLRKDPKNITAFDQLYYCCVSSDNEEELSRQITHLEPFYKNDNPYRWYFMALKGRYLLMKQVGPDAEQALVESISHRTVIDQINALAHARWLSGKREGAMDALEQSLMIDPAQTGNYLRLHGLAEGWDTQIEPDLEQHDITILLYSWNHETLLRDTLHSLAATKLGNAKILILDNHSSDGTPGLLRSVAGLFPRNHTRVITLPTNIGAPAARNWLMNQPEVQASEYTAYLDDDVSLPVDWLQKLLPLLKSSPQADVAGVKVINPGKLKTIQYAYRVIDRVEPMKIWFSDKHDLEPDLGQFDLLRKPAIVMGCCHLYRTKRLREVGEFDIRFSPSQMDDMDHNIRSWLKGGQVLYHGFVSVTHHQKSGREATIKPTAMGNVMGNDYKFSQKYPPELMERLRQETITQDREQIQQAIAELRSRGRLQNVKEVPFDIV